MKKLLMILPLVILLLTACSTESDVKTEEEIRAEIRAELESEQKIKDEVKAQLDSQNSENILPDLQDAQALKEYLIENYEDITSDNYTDGTIIYHDFTQDGTDDVVFYFHYLNHISPVFLTVSDDEILQIQGDFESMETQDVAFTDDFILYTNGFGGTGISDQFTNLYVYDHGKILKTNAQLLIQGHSSGPGFSSERTGEITFDEIDVYDHFIYKEIQTGDDAYQHVYDYRFDEESLLYEITETSVGKSPLANFAPETLYSRDQPLYIDYSNYKLVVIPMQDSTHKDQLATRTIQVTDHGDETELQLTVIGEAMGLSLVYFENQLDEDALVKVISVDEPIKNEVITLKAFLPNDFSAVEVSVMYIEEFGIEGFTFNLNDMADATSYEIQSLKDDGNSN